MGKNSVIHIKDISSSTEEFHAPYPVNEERQLLNALKTVDEDRIKDILTATFSNFKRNFTPEEEVKEETGENYVEWLNRFRIEKAKELLKSGSYKTYEIAEKVGYSDYKYFSYNFKKYAGESARQYMEKTGW